MKKINKILLCIQALMMSLLMTSCVEEMTAELGTPDNPDCFGVYFPTQEGTGDLQIGPDDSKTLKFKVRRTNTRGSVSVPVTIESNHPGVFTATEIYFEEDAPTAELEVYFPSIKLGVTYDCTIRVEGDEYVSSYASNASHLSFSVTCVKWNKLVGPEGETTGLWRDGIFAEYFTLANPNLEQAVEIYERDDKPGFYRIWNVYSAGYMTNMFNMDASSVCMEKHWTYIDATDPEKVWIPTFKTGVVLSADYGEMSIASYVTENKEFDASISSIYGKLENGVITFPANALHLHFAILGWFPANSYSLHRIILPGYRALEDNVTIKAGITKEDGYIPVELSFGRDIKKVRIYTTEGEIPGSELAAIAEKIAAGTDQSIKYDETLNSGTLAYSFAKTGLYTILAVGLGEDGKLMNYAFETFGYKAAGDEKEVVLNCGLINSDKYYPDGMTSENSLEIYINGKDIKRVNAALYEREKFDKNKDQYLEALGNSNLSEASLAQINGEGLSLVQSGLVPGTEYVLAVRAYNGYSEKDFIVSAKTSGEWDYRLAYYSSEDIDYDKMMNVLSPSDYYGTYNYYAIEATNSRYCLGEVTIEASQTSYQGQPCVKVSGLFPYLRKTYGVEDDSMDFYYYDGFIWNYKLRSEYFIFEGMYVYMSAMMYEAGGSAYGGQGGMYGAFVNKPGKEGAQQCIAIMDSGIAARQGLSFEGLALLGYEDSNLTVPIGLLDLVESMVLIPKGQDPDPIYPDSEEEADEEDMDTASLKMLSKMASQPRMNLVETDEGRMMTIIDQIRSGKEARNYLDLQ